MWKLKRKCALSKTAQILVGTVALTVGRHAWAATSLFTTQNDFSGWNNSGSMVTTAVTSPDLDGSATNGLINGGGAGTPGSLSVTWSSGTYNGFGGPGEQGNAAFLAALGTTNTGAGYTAGSGQIAFDFTTPPPGTGNYFQLGVFLNYDSNFGQFFGSAVDNGNGTSTVTIPYTINATAASTYFQLGLLYNSNYNTNTPFTVDNIRVVPEPASMGLLGALALPALRRRRR